jgi:hypothetical protein
MSQVAVARGIDRFLKAAYDLFNLDTDKDRGRNNQFYLDVPVRIKEGRLPASEVGADIPYECTNPLIFLTGIETNKTTPAANQGFSESPSVSLIIGQYGLGKTELVFHVCHHMENSAEQSLPVNLALCRDLVAVLDEEPTSQGFSDLIFRQILERSQLDQAFLITEILPQIRCGNILLILDGLDELVSTQTQHNRFFSGLMRLLATEIPSATVEPFFKAVVSMRFEYLAGVTNKDASELASLINKSYSASSIPVYFLVLDYLGDSSVEAYLSGRLQDARHAFKELKEHNRLLDMLRRPLLLRLFCDLAELPGINLGHLLSELTKNENPAFLLSRFVDRASNDEHLTNDQDKLANFTWDAGKLALKSLDLYRNGKSEMQLEDIRSFIKPVDSQGSAASIDQLPPEEVLKAIHKCPFLKQDALHPERDPKHGIARFAHRIFFEYFTAQAMAAELDKASPDVTLKNKRAFDELVLNVDMRKFLRGLVPEAVWRAETRRSYGLDNRDEWEDEDTLFDVLDSQRWILLNSMTDPENPPHDTLKTIRWFLKRQTQQWLHPRYLIYNYEAVAVYLWYHRWEVDAKNISGDFSEILRSRLEEVLVDLSSQNARLRKAKELLLERILDIGRRLRYAWAKDFENNRRTQVRTVIDPEDKDIVRRIERIIEDIRSTVF